MVVPHEILAGDIEDMIVQRGGKILESYQLFDVYEGSRSRPVINPWLIPWYSCKDKTLEESEINTAMKKILNGLSSMGIELRQ